MYNHGTKKNHKQHISTHNSVTINTQKAVKFDNIRMIDEHCTRSVDLYGEQ